MKRVLPSGSKNGSKSKSSLNLMKSPLSRKSKKRDRETDNLRILLFVFAVAFILLLLPIPINYLQHKTAGCRKKPHQIDEPGTALDFFTLQNRGYVNTLEDEYDINKLECDDTNGKCSQVPDVKIAKCVKDYCYTMNCVNDISSWDCWFQYDKKLQDSYTLHAKRLDCSTSRSQRFKCTPCKLTYEVREKIHPGYFDWLAAIPFADYLKELQLSSYSYVAIFAFLAMVIPWGFSSPARKRKKKRSRSKQSWTSAMVEFLGITSKRTPRKKRIASSSSSSSSDDSAMSDSESHSDTDDELDRFFSDSS